MGTPRSGNDIEMVRIDGALPEPTGASTLVVIDTSPWVELGFRSTLSNDLRERLASMSGGRLYQVKDQPAPHLRWYRWELWGEKNVDHRRRGEFSIGGGDTGISEVRVYVEPGLMLSPHEHQAMVDDIARVLGDAMWETRQSTLGVRIEKVTGRESIAQLLVSVRVELRAAASIGRQLAVELSATRPGERGMVGAPQLTYTTNLPENHLVGWWAAHRSRALRSAEEEILLQLRARERDAARLHGDLASSRLKDLREGIDEARRWLDEVQSLQRKVATYVRHELPNWRALGPAITRDPRRKQLVDAMRNVVDLSTIEVSLKLSRLRERTFSELFELWGAVHLADQVQSLGFRLVESPRVRWLDRWSPERITWRLANGDDQVDLVFEPHAERRKLAPQPRAGPYLHRLQRAHATSTDPVPTGLFAIGTAGSPDYLIMLRTKAGMAFAIGDATAIDFDHAKSFNKWGSLQDKLKKLAIDYGGGIGWWSPPGIILCSTCCSFVLVPGLEDRWLSEDPVAKEVDAKNVLLLGGLPASPAPGGAAIMDRIRGIIDTLRSHAADGSHRIPHAPHRRDA